MDYFSIDLLIVYAFLLITLIVGIWAGRGIKDIREYAIANKMYGTGTLLLTFLATNVGGAGTVGLASDIFSDGVGIVASLSGVAISMIIIAMFVAPKIVCFDQCLTIGDVMGVLYGQYSRVITGLLGTLYSICMISMELFVLGLICEPLFGINPVYGVTGGGIVLTLYTAHGGIKSVTITDVVQFILAIVMLPLIASMAVNHAGGIEAVFTQTPAHKFDILGHEHFSYYLTLFLVWSIFPVGITSPPLFQRLLMAKHGHQLRNQYLIASFIDPMLQVTIMMIGLSAIVLYPNLEAANVVPHIIKTLLPIGMKGLAMSGVLAIILSTADSYLQSAGLLITHDVIKPLFDKHHNMNEIKWARVATFVIGIIAILVSLKASSAIGLSFAAVRFTGPLLLVPVLAGVIGLKPDKYSFYSALIATLITFSLSTAFLPLRYSHLAVLISIVANGIFFLGVHAIRNKGFIIVRRVTEKDHTTLWRPQPKQFVERLTNLLPTPKSIVLYSQNKVTKYGAPYILFGAFCCINFTFPYFMWTHELAQSHSMMTYLRLIGATLCGLILVKEKCPKSLLPYLPTFWHLTLLYCLPFTSTVMFLLTQGSVEWLINIALAIMFLIVLVDWLSFVILSALGISLGFLFYRLAIGPITLQLDFTTGYLLVYQGIFATLIGLLFARRKQKSFDTLSTQRKWLAQDNQEAQGELLSATEAQIGFMNVLKKAGIEELGSVAHLSKQLLALSKKEDNKNFAVLAQQLTDQITPMALHLDKLSHRTTGFLRLEGVVKLLLNDFLNGLQQDLQERGYQPQIAVRSLQKELQCDVAKIKKVILNSFAFLSSVVGEEEPLLLGAEDTQLGYAIDSVNPGHVKKVKAIRFAVTNTSRLPKLEGLHMAQIGEESKIKPESATDLPLLANERIVRAHYGYSSTISEGNELTLLYVVPLDLREVRSKDMDMPQMQLGTSWSRADDTYPGAQEQEQAFLQAVKKHSQADLDLVAKAIDLIKDYHGPVKRQSGEPFYLHPIAVAQIVLDYNQDEATILGALLHDTVEDTPLTLEQVELLFNKEVRTIVGGVTHMESHQATTYKVLLSHPENIHRLLGAEDPRVLYVKLADRMHNLRTIEAKSYASQRRTAEETLLFFVPLAKYLGLTEAAEELKHRSFAVLGK